MISKLSRALFMTTIVGLATISASPLAQAQTSNISARFGKSDHPTSEPNCWRAYAATVTNICPTVKYWSIPLVNVWAGRFFVTISAEGAGIGNNVGCRVAAVDSLGQLVHGPGFTYLKQFGSPQKLSLEAFVPAGGSGMVDCEVQPGGKLHTLSW